MSGYHRRVRWDVQRNATRRQVVACVTSEWIPPASSAPAAMRAVALMSHRRAHVADRWPRIGVMVLDGARPHSWKWGQLARAAAVEGRAARPGPRRPFADTFACRELAPLRGRATSDHE